MKILFLNPHIDAEHGIVAPLEARGVSVLYCCDPIQALEVLKFHPETISCAIVHREDLENKGEPGIGFIATLKDDKTYHDLPIILTTDVWTTEECATHQSGKEGVNAYLRAPVTVDAIAAAIEQVFGTTLKPGPSAMASETPATGTKLEINGDDLRTSVSMPLVSSHHTGQPADTIEPPTFDSNDSALVLDEMLLDAPTDEQNDGRTIRLEMPEVEPEPIAIPHKKSGEPEVIEDVENSKLNERVALESFAKDLDDTQYQAEDKVIAEEMPYLSSPADAEDRSPDENADVDSIPPLGDAVVPGGAAAPPDINTLKRYLLLREQDVAALSSQLKLAQDQVAKLEDLVRKERQKNTEAAHGLEEQRKRINSFEQEKKISIEAVQAELQELKFKDKSKSDKVKLLEAQVRTAADEMQRLKDRVRADIRKIRLREKELENRLEMRKRDSEALLTARENKIIELKRKLDLMEFNMDLLQDQYSKEKEHSANLKERLHQAFQAVRLAGGLLDRADDGSTVTENEERPAKPKAS